MTEQNNGESQAQFHREGENPFGEVDTEEGTSDDSHSENETGTDNSNTPGEEEENQEDPDKDKPFHQHPRWIQRENEWNTRFNEQETRHQEDLKKLREEFGATANRGGKEDDTQMPSWFGGTPEMWKQYRADRDAELAAAEERATQRINSQKANEEKAVKEATEYMHSEITAIESDKNLNPNGIKIDQNKLVKIVLDNELIDSKGRWNYRAGFMIYQSQHKPKENMGGRKNLAGATTSETKPETKPQPFKTSADFKKNRPW